MQTSTIFTTLNGEVRPRQDATIRVRFSEFDISQSSDHVRHYRDTGEYIIAELLEFHPSIDPTGFGRACAFIKPEPELLRPELAPIYQLRGAGFLEEPYLAVHESHIHKDDFQELMHWCRLNNLGSRDALIIHPCPMPWPMFKKGDRVVVVDHVHRGEQDLIGQTGTLFQDSLRIGRSRVDFDDPESLERIDGSIYPYYEVPSISLRKLELGE